MTPEDTRPDAAPGYRWGHARRLAWAAGGPAFTRPGHRLNGEPWSPWTREPIEGAPLTSRAYGPEYKRPGAYGPGGNNRGGNAW